MSDIFVSYGVYHYKMLASQSHVTVNLINIISKYMTQGLTLGKSLCKHLGLSSWKSKDISKVPGLL